MIERNISKKVLYYAKKYPVVTITGPRQSGKTTLCKMLFPHKSYVSLESIEEREFAKNDPKGFLSNYPNGAVIDEIQRVPDLLSYVQVAVDTNRQNGNFIITGSQNFEIMNTVSQSLAGRTAIVRLLPLTIDEVFKFRKNIELDEFIYTGSYPGIYNEHLNPTEAISFYVTTYIERDLRQLLNVKDLSRFNTFLKLCAGRTGQILNFSSLANDCGINHNTAKSWLSILEASYIVKLLKPYYRNFNKRLIKAPKLYFMDTGLASFLLGIQNRDHLSVHPLKGALFETLVYSEILKIRFNRGETDNLYYFRDSKGNEVDILLDFGDKIDQIEVKSAQTIVKDFFKGLSFFKKLNSDVRNSYIIYGGDASRRQQDTEIVSWKDMHLLHN